MSTLRKRMSSGPVKEGAEFNLRVSPYGNPVKRGEWVERIAALGTFEESVAALVEWRAAHEHDAISDQDDLWIEAKLEEKVATGRFAVMTYDQVRTETLTAELVAEVCDAYLERAHSTPGSADLELLVAEFRARYRPPMMPSSPFMRTETVLAEILMKNREKGYYRLSLDELRASRGVTMLKTGKRA